MVDYDKVVINTPVECDKCKGKIYYVEKGQYLCKACGHITLDDFSKIRNFLEEKSDVIAQMLAEKIGVNSQSVEYLIHKAVMDIPMENTEGAKCERCGCSISSGRFCSLCTRELAGGIRTVFFQENKRQRF